MHLTPNTPARATDALARQFEFLAELDKLKSVMRQSPLIDRSRKENSAEHGWHLSMFALTLAEHAGEVDVLHVVRLLLVHDIVEIDAGDHPIHASSADAAQIEAAERRAARRIFGLLPGPQAEAMLGLWEEFEAAQTPEAVFAKSLDRLQPLLLNTLTDGGTWTENGVSEQQVLERYGPVIERGSPVLWEAARQRVRAHFASREARAGQPG
ncbi:HD domain-containing protein [Burkholderia gladioli]|uniref:Hydrolase n=1 Tax=Burkholderia gladioli TaxID=28095 RepID=A0A2A7S6J4_BURGA|nr:HD domain-containing protein [Burkholderia gladioli]MBU9427414.1 HD domain-containing protein [Burkholderia gladioli]MDN8064517.1 HD domain-containing protein [Burkholderia gladioli]PEH39083.1 hydrolase [Burkholderia gladioli]QPQ81877.1 HD domain-containing protein [Burkholderia gladioli]